VKVDAPLCENVATPKPPPGFVTGTIRLPDPLSLTEGGRVVVGATVVVGAAVVVAAVVVGAAVVVVAASVVVVVASVVAGAVVAGSVVAGAVVAGAVVAGAVELGSDDVATVLSLVSSASSSSFVSQRMKMINAASANATRATTHQCSLNHGGGGGGTVVAVWAGVVATVGSGGTAPGTTGMIIVGSPGGTSGSDIGVMTKSSGGSDGSGSVGSPGAFESLMRGRYPARRAS
jgi:hypothetical protein